MCNCNVNEKILIGRTKNTGKITVCKNCQSFLTPHFNYSWGKHCEKSLFFDRAQLIDDFGNLSLNRRRDLQSFLTPQNWQKMIQTWNAHNQEQISEDTHVPFYINLLQCQDIARSTNNKDEEMLGGMIYIVVDDEDARPHFHFRKKDSGKDWAISLIEAKYLEPTPGKLPQIDVANLVAYLHSCKNESSHNRYQALVGLWNDQNSQYSGRYQRLDEDQAMPDYTLLTFREHA